MVTSCNRNLKRPDMVNIEGDIKHHSNTEQGIVSYSSECGTDHYQVETQYIADRLARIACL